MRSQRTHGIDRRYLCNHWIGACVVGRAGLFPIGDDARLLMPAIVWAEALAGVRLADSAMRAAKRLAILERIRQVIGVEPFTEEAAEHHADIYAELTAEGRMIPQNDISVAATARTLGFGVLVGPKDEVHFRWVKGLEVRVLG